eukprot:TRINITY_DN6916_c0_g1_i1.p1 TRINITY_DN6916_c0_g1~~TRINITY_DN6916_c0_g1_i1.p1  ORF type:complete len:1118 (+),score=297.46 TRINITY_DN6916_c0_g1_i1:65-3418(+)
MNIDYLAYEDVDMIFFDVEHISDEEYLKCVNVMKNQCTNDFCFVNVKDSFEYSMVLDDETNEHTIFCSPEDFVRCCKMYNTCAIFSKDLFFWAYPESYFVNFSFIESPEDLEEQLPYQTMISHAPTSFHVAITLFLQNRLPINSEDTKDAMAALNQTFFFTLSEQNGNLVDVKEILPKVPIGELKETLLNTTRNFHYQNYEFVERFIKIYYPHEENYELPIDAHKDRILRAIEEYDVTMITADTGAGKSTRVPLFLHEKYPEDTIVCTQPRRLACTSVAKRVANSIGTKIGSLVGYAMRGDVHIGDSSKMIFYTTGYFNSYLKGVQDCMIDYLFIDEVHERSLDVDILLYNAITLLKEKRVRKVILLSATLESKIFTRYFSKHGFSVSNTLNVGALRYPIDRYFIDDIDKHVEFAPQHSNYEEYFFNLIQSNEGPYHSLGHVTACIGAIINKYQNPGDDWLIFVPGITYLHDVQETLTYLIDNGVFKAELHFLHSLLVDRDTVRQFSEPCDENTFRIFIATDIAESSITFPDLKYVINTGWQKEVRYSNITESNLLSTNACTRASSIQREGRCGRVRPGVVFHLFSKRIFEQSRAFRKSEIHMVSLEKIVYESLSFAAFYNISPAKFIEQLIDPPKREEYNKMINILKNKAALSLVNGKLCTTVIGKLAADLDICANEAHFLLMAAPLGYLYEAIVILGIIQSKGVYFDAYMNMVRDRASFNRVHGRFQGLHHNLPHFSAVSNRLVLSDIITHYNMYQEYLDQRVQSKHKFCNANGISQGNLNSLHTNINSFIHKLVKTNENLKIRRTRILSTKALNHLTFLLTYCFYAKIYSIKRNNLPHSFTLNASSKENLLEFVEAEHFPTQFRPKHVENKFDSIIVETNKKNNSSWFSASYWYLLNKHPLILYNDELIYTKPLPYQQFKVKSLFGYFNENEDHLNAHSSIINHYSAVDCDMLAFHRENNFSVGMLHPIYKLDIEKTTRMTNFFAHFIVNEEQDDLLIRMRSFFIENWSNDDFTPNSQLISLFEELLDNIVGPSLTPILIDDEKSENQKKGKESLNQEIILKKSDKSMNVATRLKSSVFDNSNSQSKSKSKTDQSFQNTTKKSTRSKAKRRNIE